MADFKDLTRFANGDRIVIERARLVQSGVSVEGAFDLPPLAQLTMEDQVFVAAFVRSHGSIKEMERLFGVSYPTVKSRLNRLAEILGSVLGVESEPVPSQSEVLDRLERGEITAAQAEEELRR